MKSKKVLLVVNGLSCNGAPIYMLWVARILKNNGYDVTVLSYQDGVISPFFAKEGIEVFIAPAEDFSYTKLRKYVNRFSFVIAFTITTYEIVEICRYSVPCIWYIHEGRNIGEFVKDIDCLSAFRKKNKLWVVSEHAKEYIYRQWNLDSKVIHNFVPDEKMEDVQKSIDKVKFLMIGNFIEIKGYDILIAAYQRMEENCKRKCELHFAGDIANSEYASDIRKQLSQLNNVYDHGRVVEREDVLKLYTNCDVVVVPSRDESCSLVTLEAAMMGKPVIVSDNVGAKYMIDKTNGWIYETENIGKLQIIMESIINKKYDLSLMGRCSRKKYELFATEEQYIERIAELIKQDVPKSRFLWKLGRLPLFIRKFIYESYFKSPFGSLDIPRGSRVVVYGAGKNGRKWKRIIERNHFVKIVGWVDKYVKEDGINGIEWLKAGKYNYVLITLMDDNKRREIRKELEMLGINLKKVIDLVNSSCE